MTKLPYWWPHKQPYAIMDCIDGMKELQDECVDLVVTSPPYDSKREYKKSSSWSWNVFVEVASELYRLLKTGGVIVWIVSDQQIKNDETGTSFRHALFFKNMGLKLFDTMIFYKSGIAVPSINHYPQNFDYMFVFSKGNPKCINLIKDRKNLSILEKGAKTKIRQPDGGFLSYEVPPTKEYGVRYNVWEGKRTDMDDPMIRNHPATFPKHLSTDHILSWSNAGDIILDPFLGSGTTILSALESGRIGIGFEIEKEYEIIIKHRLSNADEERLVLTKDKRIDELNIGKGFTIGNDYNIPKIDDNIYDRITNEICNKYLKGKNVLQLNGNIGVGTKNYAKLANKVFRLTDSDEETEILSMRNLNEFDNIFFVYQPSISIKGGGFSVDFIDMDVSMKVEKFILNNWVDTITNSFNKNPIGFLFTDNYNFAIFRRFEKNYKKIEDEIGVKFSDKLFGADTRERCKAFSEVLSKVIENKTNGKFKSKEIWIGTNISRMLFLKSEDVKRTTFTFCFKSASENKSTKSLLEYIK